MSEGAHVVLQEYHRVCETLRENHHCLEQAILVMFGNIETADQMRQAMINSINKSFQGQDLRVLFSKQLIYALGITREVKEHNRDVD